MRLLVTFLTALFAFDASFAAGSNADSTMNALLEQILQRDYQEGGYTVVEPMTTVSMLKPDDPEDWAKFRAYIHKQFKAHGYQIKPLLDQLIKKNEKPIPLTLKSSPKDGYIIDYDGKFTKYFDKDGGGWERWYKEHPEAHGLTRVSIPVYDQRSGLVLVYAGTQEHWVGGSGFLILYSNRNGKLKELNRFLVWIS